MNPRIRQRTLHRIFTAGANRGAEGNFAALTTFAKRTSAPTSLIYGDPVPGRAAAIAERARRDGLDASGVEARAEDVIDSMGATAVFANVDNPATLASVIDASRARAVPLLGLLIVQLPDLRLAALMMSLRGDDPQAERLARFYRALAGVTARGGSKEVFGAGAPPLNGLLEPSIRRAFRAHTEAELGRVVANVAAEREPAEIAIAGRAPVPFVVTETPAFGDPREVVGRLIESGDFTLRRGRTMVAAEVTPDGIRLHEARLRTVDGALDVRPVSSLTPETMERLRARTARPADAPAVPGAQLRALASPAPGQLAAASQVESVRSDTITRTRPSFTTD